MMPNSERVKVYSNSTNEKGFTINASPDAFRILSSGIYSNKIRAIIRELSCNAYDSHVMAGCTDRPFKVHLPDAWEPFFSVEDFGIGLDDDDINNIYTSYFTSTKTGSNDTIGGLGLGSKSPFSYTETFTVRARKDSVERVYNAYVSEAGMPAVSLMTETDTDEPNGVMVTVPVKTSDFYTFQREANFVYSYFEVLPKINIVTLNNSIVKKLADEAIIVDHHNSGAVTAIMGNVAYRVEVTETHVPKTHTKLWRFLERSSLTLRYDIGELSVAASRETISFDTDTRLAFISKIDNIASTYYDKFQNHIDTEIDNAIDALYYAEDELGEWSYEILSYEGRLLSEYSNDDAFLEIWGIIDPNSSTETNCILYKAKRGYQKQIKKTVFADCDEILYKNILSKETQFSFVMDDTEHHRGFDKGCRDILRSQVELRFVIAVSRLLTDDEKENISDILGDRLDDFHKLTDVKERFKVVRQREAAIKGPRKAPVERVKKNEMRLNVWINNQTIASGSYSYHIPNLKIDIDELASKRVLLIEVNRGTYERKFLASGYSVQHNVLSAILISKIFDFDYIVFATPKQAIKIIEKMPYVVKSETLDWKDVKDNEFGFAYQFIKSTALMIPGFKKQLDDKNSVSWLNGLIFNQSEEYKKIKGTDVANVSKIIENLNIPDFNVEDHSQPLRAKLDYFYSRLTDVEMKVCNNYSDCFSTCDTSNNPWKLMMSMYNDNVGASTIEKFKEVNEKYPLIKHLISKVKSGETEVIEELNKYIEHIHSDSLVQEFYKQAA